MDLETKFDLILKELKNICLEIDIRFEKVDTKFEQIDARFDNLEKRFDKFEEENKSEHNTMFNMINSLNSAFLRFETEQSSKIDYLLRKTPIKFIQKPYTLVHNLV